MKQIAMLACATLILSIVLIFQCMAVEYKTLDTQYYKAEYPADWTINEVTSNYMTSSGGRDPTIRTGINGIAISQNLDSKTEGLFNKDGSINEAIIHFYETFQVKKPATNFTTEPKYKTYENKYFRVEYPTDWIVYPNEKKCSYHFQVPIPNQTWGANTNVTWNVECYDAAEVNLDPAGVTIRIEADKDYTGSFLNDGFVNKGLIRFLKTFKVKSYPTPNL